MTEQMTNRFPLHFMVGSPPQPWINTMADSGDSGEEFQKGTYCYKKSMLLKNVDPKTAEIGPRKGFGSGGPIIELGPMAWGPAIWGPTLGPPDLDLDTLIELGLTV